ncbi:sulfatase-like hydrolase/transferase [Devosia nitrariae]|uniref:Sulfatase n=1 Tax=Devosia nitrariae TaxID=2071872 RepID=A0ABQ5WB24_9HYPH|nr:sulfatase-like hydrolase/transferase [Devosia nitrariae]GLQ57063.1 sulfatase [Devosia nitrariae]
MKAIVVMFDSLNRKYLPAYGADWTGLPNFRRLQERTVTFDTCYGGSMPCMPARREMHTGRYNFLHRSWGPLEPFDDSVPEMLKFSGVHTHLVTDHTHYWEDGGATYHTRFSTFEFFRGQEGDPWKGQVAEPEIPETLSWREGRLWRQDWVNRHHLDSVDKHPQTLTFDAGIEFIATNKDTDRWLVQIETFDPHEPFFSYDEHKARYPHDYNGPHFDWPDYRPVIESDSAVAHARMEYAALLSMCDDSLGRVLDAMDEHGLWDDTMLIVCTDHGFLLGERNWWGKNVQPWYEQNIHTPLFVWDPRTRVVGKRRKSLVQTIDLGPTLLDYFGLAPTADMQGRALRETIAEDRPVREVGLFGVYGGHVSVTDGRYVYMRCCAEAANGPLEQYTLMPTHMAWRFTPSELTNAELSPPLPFTKGVPVLCMAGRAMGTPYVFGTLLYDLASDPDQLTPLNDPALERVMAQKLVTAMRANHAPSSQFERLGLPEAGPVEDRHLLIERQWPQVESSYRQERRTDTAADYGSEVSRPLREIVGEPAGREAIRTSLGFEPDAAMLGYIGHLNAWQLSVMLPGISPAALRSLDQALSHR